MDRFVLRDCWGYVVADWEVEPPREELLRAAGMTESLEYYQGNIGWEYWPEGFDPDAAARAENAAVISGGSW